MALGNSIVAISALLLLYQQSTDAKIEAKFEYCCALGTSWATEGLKCEKFTGPVSGVAQVEQGLCLEAVDICCIRAYHEQQCQKGKAAAREGAACATSTSAKSIGRGDYHRDCCEGCKLGILAGSMGQGCSFKSFSFGIPWDPAFLECCHESLPSTTDGIVSTDSMNSTSTFSTDNTQSTASDSFSSSLSSSSSSSSSSSQTTSLPTPPLDDLCKIMKGLLCTDICIPTPDSYYCACPEGSTLLEDGKTCRKQQPEDRCKSTNPCEQRCKDDGVSVTCSCFPGYSLADDKRSYILNATDSTDSTDSDESNESSPKCPTGYRYNSSSQVCDDVNECEENLSLCYGYCQNTIGSFKCTSTRYIDKRKSFEACPPGYIWDLVTNQCSDIDECVEMPDACPDDMQYCLNTPGSFTCHDLTKPKSCPAGFKFDADRKICKDVDECMENIHSCLNESEECRNTEGAYECNIKCQIGFVYSSSDGVCVDNNECASPQNPCGLDACINTVGSYECDRDGGDQEEEDEEDDEDEEEEDEDEEEEDGETKHVQRPQGCPPGYHFWRDRCVDIDECKEGLHSCYPHEYCINEVGSYRCKNLNEDFTQQNTIPAKDQQQDAHEYSFTTSLPKTFRTSTQTPCLPGYQFRSETRQCEDINECLENECNRDHMKCLNVPGSYRCECESGYNFFATANGEICQDVDECELRMHSCNLRNEICVNTNGSYRCEIIRTTTTARSVPPSYSTRRRIYDLYGPCSFGHRRSKETGQCVDIDECVEGPGCREHEKCQNLPGGYECSRLCSTGWYFNPVTKGCQDVDECLLGRHNCPQRTHVCVNTNGSFVCESLQPCSNGFRRFFNGTCIDIDECAEKLDNCRVDLHRYCVNREGTFECVTRYPACSPGYEFSLGTQRCEDIDECATGRYTCDSRLSERCINLQGSYRCERLAGSGKIGQRPACQAGHRYSPLLRRCADIDECAENTHTCGDKRCYNQPGGYSCADVPKPLGRRPTTQPLPQLPNTTCPPGTRSVRGRGCVDVNECQEQEDACSSNEQCVNTMGSYSCKCKTGFRRDNLTQACVDINECQLKENDCLSTQRCDNTIGSYTCVRFLPCGTGYTLNAATEICEDDDECALGTHDCGGGYHCRNTLGSYRCDRNSRNPFSTTSTSTARAPTTSPLPVAPPSRSSTLSVDRECPKGFQKGPSGSCVDIDECKRNPSICPRSSDRCLNTMGSYKCASRFVCSNGYALDPSGTHCVDVDECAQGIHECGPKQRCENKQGGYVCSCPPGHALGPNKDCVDVDECSIYQGKLCGSNSKCQNTVGSYRCSCDDGFENVGDSQNNLCQDVNECERTPGLCQHTCLNAWGSYRCSCNPGYRINADNRSCTDIDECEEFKDNNLCIGICENTPGSYSCRCPDGYRLGLDGRTCQDIDECASGRVCRGPNEVCQNVRGSFRCNRIDCPSGYRRENDRKNRCVRTSRYCHSSDLACIRSPSHYSYNFITFVSMLPIPPSGQLELFTMRGTHLPGSTVQFTMSMVDSRAPPGIQQATESCFELRKPIPNQAVLVMTRSIQGPQEIELDLSMEIYHQTIFAGSAVAKLFIYVSQYEF